jgi:hypothetical protein
MTAKYIRARAEACRSLPAMAAGLLVLLAVTPMQASAQEGLYRISQRATLSQKLGSTLISLDYSRPLVRNRTDLFGKVVHWGELWTPGANEATVLEVDEEVKLNGNTVAPGRWSMWIVPSRVGPWEMVLEARDSLFHTQRPELTDEQVRFIVEAHQDAPLTEALTWSFPRIAQDGGTMRLNWGSLQIDMDVEVKSIEPVTTVTADEAALYVGTWRVTAQPNPEMGQAPPPTVLTVRHSEDGSLLASVPPGAFGPPPDPATLVSADESKMSAQERERAEARRVIAAQQQEAFEYLLVPRARGIFLMGWIQDGLLYDVEQVYHEFEFEEGRAVRLTVRGDNDQIFATATRDSD